MGCPSLPRGMRGLWSLRSQLAGFPDSADALQYLKKHYKLAILSNVDNETFSHSNRRLKVEFDAIFTAEESDLQA